MASSAVKPKFAWSANIPIGPGLEIATGDGVISEIVPWGLYAVCGVVGYIYILCTTKDDITDTFLSTLQKVGKHSLFNILYMHKDTNEFLHVFYLIGENH